MVSSSMEMTVMMRLRLGPPTADAKSSLAPAPWNDAGGRLKLPGEGSPDRQLDAAHVLRPEPRGNSEIYSLGASGPQRSGTGQQNVLSSHCGRQASAATPSASPGSGQGEARHGIEWEN